MRSFGFSKVGCLKYAFNLTAFSIKVKGIKKTGLLSDKYVFSTLEKMTNDIDQMRSEVGNIQDKLESLMMARQEETQYQGLFV